MKWLDLVDSINVIARLEMLVGAVLHSRPRGLRGKPRAGAPTGFQQITLRRDNPLKISGADATAYLKRFHIVTWGHRTTSDHFVWYIKKAQADFAEYLLRELVAGRTHPAWSHSASRPTTIRSCK